MRLLLINGKPGTGKTSVSRALLDLLPHSTAWIDTDDLMRVRPFGDDRVFGEALDRGLLLAEDFRKRNYDTVILTGCVHSTELAEHVKRSPLSDCDTTYVLLTATVDASKERKRAQGYSPAMHPDMFEIIRNDSASLTEHDAKPWRWLSIDTSSGKPEQVAKKLAAQL